MEAPGQDHEKPRARACRRGCSRCQEMEGVDHAGEQTMFISMQWSEEVLRRYGCNTAEYNREKLAFVHNCAKMFPRFKDDFVPQANLVRWLKHCALLSVLQAS